MSSAYGFSPPPLQFENYTHGMEQLATVKKAELTGSKPVTKAILFYGCQKMFQDAASSFEKCGSSAFAYAQQCNVGPRRRCE